MKRLMQRAAIVAVTAAALGGAMPAGPANAGDNPWIYYNSYTKHRLCNIIGMEGVHGNMWVDYRCQWNTLSRVWDLQYRK